MSRLNLIAANFVTKTKGMCTSVKGALNTNTATRKGVLDIVYLATGQGPRGLGT